MFDGFAGHWTPVELSRRVATEPRLVQVAGDTVELSRGSRGAPHAKLLCRSDDGQVARRLPVREAAGLLWIFTDTREDGRELPDLAPLTRSSLALDLHVEASAVPWERALERLLRQPHLVSSAAGPVGGVVRAWLRPEQVERVEVALTRAGATVEWELAGRLGVAAQGWLRPNGVSLQVGLGRPGAVALYAWCVPLDATSTRVLVAHAHTGVHVASHEAGGAALSAPSGALVERFRRWHLRYGQRSSASLRV